MKYSRLLPVIFALSLTVAAEEQRIKLGEDEVTIDGQQMELKEQGKVVIFRGDVVVTHQNQVLEADQMTQNKETGHIQAEGHVRMRRQNSDGTVMTGFGDGATYEQVTGEGTLTGKRPYLTYRDPRDRDKSVQVYATRFDFSERDNTLVGHQDVELIQSATSWATAEKATFRNDVQALTLEGGPPRPQMYRKMDKGEAYFNSDRMIFYLKEKKAELIDRAKGLLIPAQPASAKSEKPAS